MQFSQKEESRPSRQWDGRGCKNIAGEYMKIRSALFLALLGMSLHGLNVNASPLTAY